MVVTIKKVFLSVLVFLTSFIFNISEIDSNIDKLLMYDINNENMEYYTVYFENINSHELRHILKNVNVEVIYYLIDNKRYYVRNIDVLYDKYTLDMSLEDKIVYDIKGLKIDGIRVFALPNKLSLIENLTDVY